MNPKAPTGKMYRKRITELFFLSLMTGILGVACSGKNHTPAKEQGTESSAQVSDTINKDGNGQIVGVTVREFCGYSAGLDIDNTKVVAAYLDCEAGYSSAGLSKEEGDVYRNIFINGVISAKYSDMMMTGGTTTYIFYSKDNDTQVAQFTMYGEYIVGDDGMYEYEFPVSP